MDLARYSAPMVHHSDQGSQYAAAEYTYPLNDAEVLISMSAVGQPTENSLVERFIQLAKEEYIDFAEYNNFDDMNSCPSGWKWNT